MKQILVFFLALAAMTASAKSPKVKPQLWPDGTVMDSWFQNTQKVDVDQLGKNFPASRRQQRKQPQRCTNETFCL